MGVLCIKVYYSEVFWVLWVLKETQCTFPAANQNIALLGASALSWQVSGSPGEKALVLPCIHTLSAGANPLSVQA